MIDVNPSSQKPVFGKLFTKYYPVIIFILVIVISLLLYFHHKESAIPKNAETKANMPISSTKIPLNNKSVSSTDSAGIIKAIYALPVKQPVVYITIDDGWYPNQEVLKIMQQYHLPITTYLIEQAAQRHPDFWHDFVNAGGHIEDHTFNHPFLTHLSKADQINQISQPINYFRQYGPPPDELRPPYGDFNSEVGQAAKDSGIKHIVMWNAEMKNSIFTTRNGQELKPGDIILLHWEPGLDQEIIKVLNIIQKQNLGVADLTQGLNSEPLTICWLKAPIPISKSTPASNSKTTISLKAAASKTKITSRSKVSNNKVNH
jgi:Predicted xylanase/chitin deacetylase